MSRLTRDGTAEPVSREQIIRHAWGQGNVHFPCSADHEQDWQPYPVDPYSAIFDDQKTHTCIHTALGRENWLTGIYRNAAQHNFFANPTNIANANPNPPNPADRVVPVNGWPLDRRRF